MLRSRMLYFMQHWISRLLRLEQTSAVMDGLQIWTLRTSSVATLRGESSIWVDFATEIDIARELISPQGLRGLRVDMLTYEVIALGTYKILSQEPVDVLEVERFEELTASAASARALLKRAMKPANPPKPKAARNQRARAKVSGESGLTLNTVTIAASEADAAGHQGGTILVDGGEAALDSGCESERQDCEGADEWLSAFEEQEERQRRSRRTRIWTGRKRKAPQRKRTRDAAGLGMRGAAGRGKRSRGAAPPADTGGGGAGSGGGAGGAGSGGGADSGDAVVHERVQRGKRPSVSGGWELIDLPGGWVKFNALLEAPRFDAHCCWHDRCKMDRVVSRQDCTHKHAHAPPPHTHTHTHAHTHTRRRVIGLAAAWLEAANDKEMSREEHKDMQWLLSQENEIPRREAARKEFMDAAALQLDDHPMPRALALEHVLAGDHGNAEPRCIPCKMPESFR